VPRLLDVIPTPTKILSSTFVIRPVVLVVAGDCSAFRFSCTFFHNFKTSSNCCLQLTPGKPLLLSDPSSIHSPVVFGAQLGQLVLGSTLTIFEQLLFLLSGDSCFSLLTHVWFRLLLRGVFRLSLVLLVVFPFSCWEPGCSHLAARA